MRITAMAVAALAAGTLLTAGPALAEVTAQPAPSHFNPLEPSFGLTPQSDAEEIRREITDLDAAWGGLSPQERNQRLNHIQQLLTNLDFETRNMPKNEKAGVDLILLPSLANLASLTAKAQGPGQPCYFPACLPGL